MFGITLVGLLLSCIFFGASQADPMVDKYTFGINGNCTFDQNLCNWQNAISGDQFDWIRNQGGTGSASTGPAGDAGPTGKGHYVYIEASHPRVKGQTASLIVGPLVGVLCMRFSYHMRGSGIGDLQIFMSERGPVGQTFVWAKYGKQGRHWRKDKVTVYGFAFDILIVARVGNSYTGDTAVDEISFVPGTCFPEENAEELLLRRLGGPNNSTETKGSCAFDMDMCGWSQDILDDHFDWKMGDRTQTQYTGPDKDHGGKIGGQFLYIETSSPRRFQDKARLMSPQLCGQVCIRFYYHMFGTSVGTLSVFRKDGINREDDRLWYTNGNKGNKWYRAIIEVNSDQDCYQVVFEGKAGKSFNGDLAIDDIYVQKGTCCDMKSELNTIDKTGNCDFRKGFCGWTNLKIDDFNWSLGRGSTHSKLTGPSRGFGKRDGYAFIESSEPRFIGDTAIMASGVLLGSMCMRFRYHMYGEEIGTLSVFRHGDGIMQQLLWQQDGNQGNTWHETEFIIDCNVTAYQVEIEATVGGWRGDIAVDEIKFTPGACPPKPVIIIERNYTGTTAKPAPKVSDFRGYCNFAKSFCAWKNDLEEDYFDWIRNKGPTATQGTGPKYDYTGDGYYLYMEASIRRPGEFARLVSGSLQDYHCLKFRYHMYGDGVGDLRVEVKDSENGYLWNTTWSVSGNQGEFWFPAAVTVYGYDYVVGISAVRGSSYLGDIALDNIQLYKGSCFGSGGGGRISDDGDSLEAGNKFNLVDTDFELQGKGAWKDDNVNGDFTWTRGKGKTPSGSTGPDSGHGGQTGHYLFIESSSPRKLGHKARIYLDNLDIDVCMRFYYHMYGTQINQLYVKTRNKRTKAEEVAWSKKRNQGRRWHQAVVSLTGGKDRMLIIEGVCGNGYQGDIAIDDITFVQGYCPRNKN